MVTGEELEMTNQPFDKIDRELLNILQKDFPLEERPFCAIANLLNISENEVITRTKKLKGNVIRQISAIFDTKSLGYSSSLVAAKVDVDLIDEAADIINKHPGVTHNYQRNHEFNLWFTIAVPSDSRLGLERTIEVLGRIAGVNSIRALPTLKVYKIGVQLDMTGKNIKEKMSRQYYNEESRRNTSASLSEDYIEIIKKLQMDLPIVPNPFDSIATEIGISVGDLLEKSISLKEDGVMRRFAAVLYHRRAGFSSNGMGAWNVPEDVLDEIGTKMASYSAVSHCYLRPTYEDWPYNIFTMVHGKDEKQVEEIFKIIENDTGIKDRFILYSTKEYKKTRLQYFDSNIHKWEKHIIDNLNIVT